MGMIWDLQFVYLCPSFFSIPLVPSPDQCPQLVAAGTRLGETYLMETQTTILLRELVTLYLKWHQGPLWDAVNEVMTLPVEEAVNNPGSYAWYAACKFELTPFLSFSFTSDVMVAIIVCVIAWANHDLCLAFAR